MANVYIKGVSGGETTTPTGSEGIPLDDGTNSTWISINNLRKLPVSEASVTTANVTGVAWTRHVLDLSGLTANRNFVLPSPTAGQEIELIISTGDDTYFLVVIGDTGVTINGGSAATEFHRLQTTGRTLTFRATSSSNWQCVGGLVEVLVALKDYAATPPFSISTQYTGFMPIITPFKLKRVSTLYYGNATTNGSNYWTFDYIDGGATSTANFNATVQGAWTTVHKTTFSKTDYTAADLYFAPQITTGAGTPGSIYAYTAAVMWLS